MRYAYLQNKEHSDVVFSFKQLLVLFMVTTANGSGIPTEKVLVRHGKSLSVFPMTLIIR